MADDLKIRVPVELDTSKVKDDIPKLNNILANDNKAHAKSLVSWIWIKHKRKFNLNLLQSAKI